MKDTIQIEVIGGRGGNGCISLRRESFLPKGGPDGGDGGIGGNVVVRGESGLTDLSRLGEKRIVKGSPGGSGEGKGKRGKGGAETFLPVPLGTLVWRFEDKRKFLLSDVTTPGQVVQVAKGGGGGRGNIGFATSTNKMPLLAESGEEGENISLLLDLRLPVDVALVGKPNSGKSLLLRQITNATAAVADYPFTTREPYLATASFGWENILLVELPGIIKGASEGKGLGNAFLKHLWRARVLLHVVSGSAESPVADYKEVCDEIALFDPALLEKPQLIIVNRIDLPEVKKRVPAIKRQLAHAGAHRLFISPVTGEGVEALVKKMHELRAQAAPFTAMPVREELQTITPRPQGSLATVSRDGAVFVVSSPKAERLAELPDLRQFKVRLQFREQLARMGIVKALEGAGVKHGDVVRIGARELRWE